MPLYKLIRQLKKEGWGFDELLDMPPIDFNFFALELMNEKKGN